MNLKPLGANRTEVETERYKILFSYKTPVAYFDKQTGKYFKTIARWSNTTSKHITQWYAGPYEPAEQETISNLCDKVGN